MSYTDADYASAVWSAGTRTLVSGSAGSPSSPAEVWAAAIWAYSTRTLTGTLPIDFLAAVVSFFGTSAAATSITGGIYTALPAKTAPLPYCVFEEAIASLSYTSSTTKARKTRVRFKVYADDPEAVSAMGDALEDAFANQTLVFSGGFTGPFVIGDRGHKDEKAGLANSGKQGWYFLVEFTVNIVRGR